MELNKSFPIQYENKVFNIKIEKVSINQSQLKVKVDGEQFGRFITLSEIEDVEQIKEWILEIVAEYAKAQRGLEVLRDLTLS